MCRFVGVPWKPAVAGLASILALLVAVLALVYAMGVKDAF